MVGALPLAYGFVVFGIGTERRGADEFIPMDVCWDLKFGRPAGHPRSLRPTGAIGPHIGGTHRADDPRLNHFNRPTKPTRRRSLVAHLGCNAHLLSDLA